MKRRRVFSVIGIVVAIALIAGLVIRSRFERDLAAAAERAAQGSVIFKHAAARSNTSSR